MDNQLLIRYLKSSEHNSYTIDTRTETWKPLEQYQIEVSNLGNVRDRRMKQDGKSTKQISDELDCSESSIYHVIRGGNWKHVA